MRSRGLDPSVLDKGTEWGVNVAINVEAGKGARCSGSEDTQLFKAESSSVTTRDSQV